MPVFHVPDIHFFICMSSLEKYLFRSSAHFCIVCGLVFLILSCMSCLYILEINHLLVVLFANIFSHSVSCLFGFFFFLMVSLLLSLIRFHFLIFVFVYLRWETDLRKYCYDLCQRMFCLCSLLGVLWCRV